MKYLIKIVAVILILLLAGLAILAQDENTEDDFTPPESITFRPIDDILDGELEVTNFAGETASLPIFTSVPVACTIVYGETEAFGSLSVDLDMDGGTHSDHNPLLTELAPDTTYFFRVQGVDDSGTLYVSDVMQFTTPVDMAIATDNLASPANGAEIIGYSSAFGDADPDATWGVNAAFDDNPNTVWSSAGDGSDAWVEVQLAEKSTIEAVAFQTRSMTDGSAIITEFTVTTETGDVYGPFKLPDDTDLYEFEVNFEAETLRFDVVNSTGGNTGAIDIAVYGSAIE